jgi:hypothetical protein
VSRRQWGGSAFIIGGTLVVGVVQVLQPVQASEVNAGNFVASLALILTAIAIGLYYSVKKTAAVLFGAVAGVLSAMDPILKRIALADGFLGMDDGTTVAVFALSFAFGFSAFLVTQVAFKKGAEASKVVPSFNSLLIAFPVFVEAVLYGIETLTSLKIMGLVIIIAGIVLTCTSKEGEE